MRVALIVNPNATRVSQRLTDRVAKLVAAMHHKVEVQPTTQPRQATALASAAVAGGAELVVTLGGDGTVNEVANGMRGSGVPLGLAGGGKTNVFQRGLGLPSDAVAATSRLLELLADGNGGRRRISLGAANGRAFTFAAGLGLDGAIVREVERRRRAKQLYGDHAYVVAGLKTMLLTYDRDNPHLAIRFPDGRPALSGYFALVTNGDPYTYLRHRPFRPTPEASFEGGLDVLVGQTMSAVRLTRALTGMLSHLPRPAYPGLPVLHDEEAFTLSSDVPLAFQLDGEYLGDFTTVAFERLEGALTVIAPAPAAARRAGR
ncbi:MAG TPA: diacylglycerol kinase family protein [Actinomycetota bacterium]